MLSGSRRSAFGVRRACARAASADGAELFRLEAELVGVAGRRGGEVDRLAVVAERHLERCLGTVAGVDGVAPPAPGLRLMA